MVEALYLALLISLAIQIGFFLLAFGLKTDKLTDFGYTLTFVVMTLVSLARNQSLKTARKIKITSLIPDFGATPATRTILVRCLSGGVYFLPSGRI